FRVHIAQALDETVAVVVEAGERSILLDDERVDRADLAREIVDAVEQREDRLLVRSGDVAAAQTKRRNAAHRGFELLGWHGKQEVSPGDAVVREPMIVNHRRARVRDGPAEKARD